MKKVTLTLVLLLFSITLAQDVYVGPDQIVKFDSISDQDLAEIKELRVLFGSRSWGMGMYNDYIRQLGSKYALRWNLYRPLTTTPADSIRTLLVIKARSSAIRSAFGVVRIRMRPATA